MDLMWFLFLAHIAGDFALQSDSVAQRKCTSVALLTYHVAIYVTCIGVTLWLFLSATSAYPFLTWSAAGLLLPLYALHWIQDYVKGHHYSESRQAFYLDQFLHLSQLYVIRLLIVK